MQAICFVCIESVAYLNIARKSLGCGLAQEMPRINKNNYTARTIAAGLGAGARTRRSSGGQHNADPALNSLMKSGVWKQCKRSALTALIYTILYV